ncbi:MAG: SCO family protein [Phycisphaerales bacterium]|nr:SCO family protein [Phycisphaerales bacterium]
MNETTSYGIRRIGWIIAVGVVAAVGWYIGSRGNKPTDVVPTSRPVEKTGIYRDIAGRIVRLSPELGSITLDHDEIPGFMRAMVMDLKVAAHVSLSAFQPDDEVVFDLARIDGTYQIVRLVHASGMKRTPATVSTADPDEPPLDRGDLVPDLALIDSHGKRFQLRQMKPANKVITFFYTRCPLQNFCPAQTKRLSELQKFLDESGSDLHLLSLTLDAEHDGTELLAAYAGQFNVDPSRWTLAGSEDPESIRRFARRAGAQIQVQPGDYQIDHALIALRIDGNRIVDRVYGLTAIEQLLRNMPTSTTR